MRILHLCNYIQPQLGYQEFFIAREHAKMGHDVTVVASDRYFPFPDYSNTVYPILGDRIVETGKTECEGFTIIRLPILFEIGTKVWLMNFQKTIKSIRPNIVICHGMSDFNVLRIIMLKKKMNFKLVCDDHGLFSEAKKGLPGFLFYNLYPFWFVLKFSNRLVGVADECVDFIVKLYKFPRSAVEMIPLGADSDKFQFYENLRSDFRKAHSIDDKEIIITYTGKLTQKKGAHHILQAIYNIKNKLEQKIVLLFVGNMEEDYRLLFESWVKKINDIARIIVLPAVNNSELVKIYSASDIAVWPRQASMSMIEASSCGIPIICCDFLKERYKNFNGIPVKEDDIDDLANALQRLIDNKPLRIEMGVNGRELVKKELSWEIIAKRFIE